MCWGVARPQVSPERRGPGGGEGSPKPELKATSSEARARCAGADKLVGAGGGLPAGPPPPRSPASRRLCPPPPELARAGPPENSLGLRGAGSSTSGRQAARAGSFQAAGQAAAAREAWAAPALAGLEVRNYGKTQSPEVRPRPAAPRGPSDERITCAGTGAHVTPRRGGGREGGGRRGRPGRRAPSGESARSGRSGGGAAARVR